MIKIDFKHWKYQFSEEDLQHGSPNKRSPFFRFGRGHTWRSFSDRF